MIKILSPLKSLLFLTKQIALLGRDKDIGQDRVALGSPFLTLSWRRPLSYRNQSIDWFVYDSGLRHERVELEVLSSILNINFEIRLSIQLTKFLYPNFFNKEIRKAWSNKSKAFLISIVTKNPFLMIFFFS